MHLVCSDMEGVFTPEIWIRVAETTGIEDLKLTTRDISDYDLLMKKRLKILEDNRIKLQDIQKVIRKMDTLEGAREFLDWLKKTVPVILVSDTFVQFAGPMIEKLGWPTLFCNSLSVASNGLITGYRLRQVDGKKKVVIALRSLNYTITGVGDSYNDINMLKEADSGILFNPPDNIKDSFTQFPVSYNYRDLKTLIERAVGI